MTDPYRVLGLTSSASEEEIKKAYRTLCKQYHPDIHAGKPDEKEAEKRFLEVQSAYQEIMRIRQGRGTSSEANNTYNPYRPYGGFWNSAYGPGYGGYDYGRQTQDDESSEIRAAKVYIDAGYFNEAVKALSGIPMERRDARWYFLNALAQSGLRNTAQALEYARQAAKMDPGNVQYQQLYAELQSGSYRYAAEGQRYGRNISMWQTPCCGLALANLCCLCMGGGGMMFYPLFCCI